MYVYARSEVGADHIAQGRGNEDSLFVRRYGTLCVFVLADGMGGTALGGRAASVAASRAADIAEACAMPHPLLLRESAPIAVRAAFNAAFNALQDEACASESRDDILQLQTTLMVAIYDETQRFLSWGYVGDGGLMAFVKGRLLILEAPQKGEDQSSTSSLLSMDWRFGSIENVDAILMVTDGLFDGLHSVGPGHRPEPNWMAEDIVVLAGTKDLPDVDIDRLLAEVRQTGSVTDDMSIVVAKPATAVPLKSGKRPVSSSTKEVRGCSETEHQVYNQRRSFFADKADRLRAWWLRLFARDRRGCLPSGETRGEFEQQTPKQS